MASNTPPQDFLQLGTHQEANTAREQQKGSNQRRLPPGRHTSEPTFQAVTGRTPLLCCGEWRGKKSTSGGGRDHRLGGAGAGRPNAPPGSTFRCARPSFDASLLILLRNPFGFRLSRANETGPRSCVSAGRGPFSGLRRRSDVVIELEFVRVRAHLHGQDLVLTLVVDPGLDEVGGEDIPDR